MKVYLNETGTKLVEKAVKNSHTSENKSLAVQQAISLGLMKISELKEEADDVESLQLPPSDMPLLLPEKDLATIELKPELREKETIPKSKPQKLINEDKQK